MDTHYIYILVSNTWLLNILPDNSNPICMIYNIEILTSEVYESRSLDRDSSHCVITDSCTVIISSVVHIHVIECQCVIPY